MHNRTATVRRQSAAQADVHHSGPVDGEDESKRAFASSQLWGLLLYSLSTLLGASTSLVAKLLGGIGGMPAMQLVFVRSCVLVACTLPHLRDPGARRLIAERHELLALRGCLGFVSVALMYMAVRLLPISDAVALAFLAPLLVAALSPLLLQERPPRTVLAALVLAAGGALLVAHPGSLSLLFPAAFGSGSGRAASIGGPSKAGVAAALGHAFTAAAAKITVRRLGIGSTSPHITSVIVLSAGTVSAVGAGAVCLLTGSVVRPQRLAHWLLLATVGLVGYGHQATMTAGLQRVPVATASSLTYLSIIWSMLADWLVFHHLPSASSLLGAAAICTGGLLVTFWRAHHRHGHPGSGGGGGGGGGRGSIIVSTTTSSGKAAQQQQPTGVDVGVDATGSASSGSSGGQPS